MKNIIFPMNTRLRPNLSVSQPPAMDPRAAPPTIAEVVNPSENESKLNVFSTNSESIGMEK